MHSPAVFRRKVRELGEAIQRLPRPRQLDLFAELETGFRVVVEKNPSVESAGENDDGPMRWNAQGHQ